MEPCTIYLLHFDRPYKHARHYLGSAVDLGDRLDRHRKGKGGRLLAVLAESGIGWMLARTWQGTRNTEKRLKSWKKNSRLCPVCAGKDPVFAAATAAQPIEGTEEIPF